MKKSLVIILGLLVIFSMETSFAQSAKSSDSKKKTESKKKELNKQSSKGRVNQKNADLKSKSKQKYNSNKQANSNKNNSSRKDYKVLEQQKDYNQAYNSWVNSIKNSTPSTKMGIMNDGEKYIRYKIKHSTNPTLRLRYVNQLDDLYRYQYKHNKSGSIAAKRGLLYYYYYPERIMYSYNSFAIAIYSLKYRTDYESLRAFMDISYKLYVRGYISQQELIRNYFIVKKILAFKFANDYNSEASIVQDEFHNYQSKLRPHINIDMDYTINFNSPETYSIKQVEEEEIQNRSIGVEYEEFEFNEEDYLEEAVIDVDVDIPIKNQINRNKYALIIGNEDYTRFQTNLSAESNVSYARNDAKVFAEYCKNTLGIPEENITILYDAIGSQMRREIKRFSSKTQYGGSNVELLLYYSGHGFPDENQESYIMPVDISGEDLDEAIKLSDLYKDLTSFQSKKVTVILDACFSGGGRNQGLLAAKAVRVKPKDELINGNLVVFSASSGTQESLFYKDKNHGLFTYFFLKKLQENHGNVSYGDMYNYLKNIVPFTANDINYKEQNPEVNYSSEVKDNWEYWRF